MARGALRPALVAWAFVAACAPEAPREAYTGTPVAGLERLRVATVGPDGGELFGHSWLDSEFGRFAQAHTHVEASVVADGAVRVGISGAWIPMYEAEFTFLPGGEACDVEVWWFRDSGPDDRLAGRITVLEGYVWSNGLEVVEGRVATHFGFSLRGRREGEPVVFGGEVLLRPEVARDG